MWKAHKKMGEVYMSPIWMVCWTSYIHGKVLFVRTPDFGASFEVAESI